MSDWQSVKYRLIGATVIVISFVFSWWLLLDHEVHRLQGKQADIPQPMEIERFDIEEPMMPATEEASGQAADGGLTEPVVEEAETSVPKDISVQKEIGVVVEAADNVAVQKKPEEKRSQKAAEKPFPPLASLSPKGLPEAWVLQIASFQEKANAQQLQKRMVEKKFPAYVKVFNMPEGKSYKVLVGPKLSKERATLMAKQIEKQFALKSMIMAYRPGFEE